jgi:photosystem II stability/assembly factor-like uncharacterized protein
MAGRTSNGIYRPAAVLAAVSVWLVLACTAPSDAPSTRVSAPITDATGGSAQPTVPPSPPWFQPSSVAFWNERHGLVGGEVRCWHCARHHVGIVFATRDAGSSWTVAYSGGYHVSDVETIARGSALMRVGRRLLRTSDGGRSWVALGHARVDGLSFVSFRLGWGIRSGSLSANLVVTTDGGRTWRTADDPCGPIRRFDGPTGIERSSARYLTGVSFVSQEQGWVECHGDGAGGSAPVAVYETMDGGAAWTRRSAVWTSEPGGLEFVDPTHGWRWPYGGGLVERSANGGASWHRGGSFGDIGGLPSAGSVSFASPGVGYALAGRLLYRSDDGGATWKAATRAFPV